MTKDKILLFSALVGLAGVLAWLWRGEAIPEILGDDTLCSCGHSLCLHSLYPDNDGAGTCGLCGCRLLRGAGGQG